MPCFFDKESGGFWLDTLTGWTKLNEGSLKRHLRLNVKDITTDEIEQEINRIQVAQHIDFASPLAGYQKGVYQMSGYKVLVTSSPDLLTAIEGRWPLIKLCTERLMSPHSMQWPVLISWLSLASHSLYLHDYIPGQILFLLGPAHCGKSFLQSLITWLLGGRSGRPWDHLQGKTQFTKDLNGAEHLIIADPPISTVKDRGAFAASLKQYAAEEDQRSHHKHLDAMMVKPFQRLSVSANDELHNVIVVPTLEPSFEDKCNVLHCAACSVPPPGYEKLSRTAFEALIRAELPAFLHFLLHEWKVPESLNQKDHCGRFRMDSWHNPVLAEMINSQSPEMNFYEVLNNCGIRDFEDWKGSVKELSTALSHYADSEAQRFSRFTNALARYLGLLHSKFPDEIYQEPRVGDKWGRWVIKKNLSSPVLASS